MLIFRLKKQRIIRYTKIKRSHPMKLKFEEMYNALLNKDSSYEGSFFAGIKTTGIFCRPTCTARKPKKENVEFFSSVS